MKNQQWLVMNWQFKVWRLPVLDLHTWLMETLSIPGRILGLKVVLLKKLAGVETLKSDHINKLGSSKDVVIVNIVVKHSVRSVKKC